MYLFFLFLRQAIVTIWQNYNAIIQNCVNRYISTFLQFILGKICRIHWTKILVHVSQHQKVVRKQVNRNESQFDVWTKSDKTRKLFQRPTLSITVNELASNIFFFVLCICIWPVFALIAFEFEVLFILLQALEFKIGSYLVIFRFLSNLFPYTLFCVFLITVFTIFELFCVALIKFLR